MSKKEFFIALLCIVIVIGSLIFALWCVKPYHTASDVPWTITDKYYKKVTSGVGPPLGAYISKNVYYLEIEYEDDNGTSQLTLEISEEEWNKCKIGETCLYPRKIISNWEHFKESIKP